MSRYGQGPPDVSNTYSLLVLNITFRTTPEDLRPIFDRYGKVQDVYIPKDRATGDSRGFAFVRYAHEADAEMAVERINGRNIDGREIVVQFAKYGRSEDKGPPRRYENDRDRDYRRDEGRRDSYRRDRDDHRRDEPRRDEYRRDDYRREDSSRGDYRREERRRSRSRDHGREEPRSNYREERRDRDWRRDEPERGRRSPSPAVREEPRSRRRPSPMKEGPRDGSYRPETSSRLEGNLNDGSLSPLSRHDD